MSICHESIRPALSQIILIALSTLLGCLIVTGCVPEKVRSETSARPDTYFPIEVGPSTLQLQLALTPAEQQKGLMFRKELPENHGMLFLSERPKQQGFWMKNTSLPLDIGYFDAGGTLLEIHKLFPFDETSVASSSRQILIAIETNRGWYAKNGISPGAQLDMKALSAAIAERGFSIKTYPFEN